MPENFNEQEKHIHISDEEFPRLREQYQEQINAKIEQHMHRATYWFPTIIVIILWVGSCTLLISELKGGVSPIWCWGWITALSLFFGFMISALLGVWKGGQVPEDFERFALEEILEEEWRIKEGRKKLLGDSQSSLKE